MAPQPEYDKEPKAPDKSGANPSEDTKTLHNLVNDQQTISDNKSITAAASGESEEGKHVDALDEGQLRNLLDEAITYKCPKDREGKSSLFKNLLEEVEQDEQACEAVCTRGAWGRTSNNNRRRNKPRGLPHSNSLQDLVAALIPHDAPPRRRPPVSSRTQHGGSLPSGVDRYHCESLRNEGGYVATVHCVNPPHASERRVSASDAQCPSELELLNTRRSKMPAYPPVTYTARASLEIGSASVCPGRAVTTTTASNQVDSGVPFSCITTPEVVSNCTTTSSTSQALAIDSKPLELNSGYAAVASLTGAALTSRLIHYQPRSIITSGFNGLPLSRTTYERPTAIDEKKSIDENGNSVQGYNSPHTSSQIKKRKKKSSKNETVINIDQMDGYQGNKDLNELLRFIESDADNSRGGNKLNRVHAKHKDDSDDKANKKRTTDRRTKDKENKMKRANSMEELSRTKLEDLTDKPDPTMRKNKKDRWTTDAVQTTHNKERRSWGDDSSDAFFYPAEDIPLPAPPAVTVTQNATHHKEKKKAKHTKSIDSAPAITQETPTETTIEMMDFQTVTKKKKPRKKFEDGDGGGGDPTHRKNRANSPERRRKSAPPSDKSNDSNDDMDSVHSLPADAAGAVPRPHASYADIARARQNIPDLIESCNFYAELPLTQDAEPEPPPPPPPVDTAGATYDVENYPALETRKLGSKGKDAKMSPPNKRIERKSAPDVVSDRRPAVILLDTGSGARDMDGVTFGFDINEQLLGGPAAAGGVRVRPGLWYLPPATNTTHPKVERHLDQIVNYVGNAWEDIIRCGNGKVRYFSE